MSFTPDPSFYQPPHNYVPQVSSWQYTTFIKRWAAEAMQDAFAAHVSKRIQATKVAVDFDQRQFTLPAVLVKYNERDNVNAGVGHEEWLPSPYDPNPQNPSIYIKYYHRMYHGQIVFEAFAQSSTDLGLVRDALVEVLATTDATPWGNQFVQRLYFYMNSTPYGYFNFPFLNTDIIRPTAETKRPLPWAADDKLMYSAGYQVEVFGDLYSATPNVSSNYGGTSIVDKVDLTVTELKNIDDPTSVIATDMYQFAGWPSSSHSI